MKKFVIGSAILVGVACTGTIAVLGAICWLKDRLVQEEESEYQYAQADYDSW